MSWKTIAAVIAILWVGMIIATDMGAIVKFSTPSLTRPVAFDVGRTVFGAFNKLQVLMLIILISSAILAGLAPVDKMLIAAIFILLLLQVFWLFPVLSQQVEMVLNGIEVTKGYQHQLFGIFEIAKLVSLFILGIRLLQ